jgi:hypothetical protein
VLVWHWVQQHRWLSVLVLAFIILSSAGGTAWALVFRTVSSPIGLREALRIYRKEQTDRVIASLRSHLPAPGVYSYRTSGGEGLNLVGVQRSFPSLTSMIVTDGRCATVSWVPITQHTESTVVCPGAGGALGLPQLRTYEDIAGTSTNSTLTCPATAYLLPAGATAGQRWRGTCALSNPVEKVTVTGQALGPATVAVGGTKVRVEHTRLNFTYRGSAQGTNPTDYWIIPSTGLIVREKELVSVTQGGVTYSENMDAVLTGLVPAR